MRAAVVLAAVIGFGVTTAGQPPAPKDALVYPVIPGVVRPILSFPADAPVSGCLERLVREHVHIALVREADGRVAGMVTLEDMLEELVGEIEDEFDSLPGHAVVSGRGWVVGGGISPGKLREATGVVLPAGPGEVVRHLSEWVLRRHAGPLRGGEVIEDVGVRVVVRKVRRRNVLEARVEPRPA